MSKYIIKNGMTLKCGYTTGSCAALATYASAVMLLNQKKETQGRITLPNNEEYIEEIMDAVLTKDIAQCCVIKDGGDDPDVTHGLKIFAKVHKIKNGFQVCGGIGVGVVTKKGLPCKIGDAAINPVPMKMIKTSLENAAKLCNYSEGLQAEIFVPKGEDVAQRTFNPRLGIMGGISILGTTGIVEPMSENAIIDTIHIEIRSKKANGEEILFLTPGNYGQEFAKEVLELDMLKSVKCSNYIGEALDFALSEGWEKILFVGHVGKLSKIAAGVMNTHSKIADCRNEVFAAHAALLGADTATIKQIMEANTTLEIHDILNGKEVYESILNKILYHINCRTRNKIQVEILMFSKENKVLAHTKNVWQYIKTLKEDTH